ncbi:hypothetical protein [Gordonibacter sp.]|uniref:hypothetical protein n=1 Tax=Gordonibacter sp. TaxID=1968902 RepID=UPI002FC9831E
MLDEAEQETKDSLKRIGRVCKSISLIVKIVFGVLCVYWVFTTAFMVFALVGDKTSEHAYGLSVLGVVLHLAYIVVIVALFMVINGIFSDAAKGDSPFTLSQVKRLRLISALLVVYCVLDFAITSNNTLLNYDGLNTGFVSTNDNMIFPLNISPLIASAVVFAFSFVFQYGVLLQEFSDDTV